MPVVGVLNPKGGAGKTTLCTNLARALQLDGAAVLVIDSDPQGTARDWYASQGADGPGPEVIGMDAGAIGRGLGRVGQGYDFVFIDGAAKIEGRESAGVVKACDAIVIPVQPSPPDIWGARDLVDVITARQEIADGKPAAAMVISRQIAGTKLADGVADVLAVFGLPIFGARTSQRIAYAEAFVSGLSVLDTEPDGRAAEEILAIKNELLQLIHG